MAVAGVVFELVVDVVAIEVVAIVALVVVIANEAIAILFVSTGDECVVAVEVSLQRLVVVPEIGADC